MVAAMRVAEESFSALRRPFHRPADPLGRPDADRLLGVDEDLGAEAAADIGRDHAQFVLGRDADEGGEHQPGHMRVLAGGEERVVVLALVVDADRRARLHRVGGEAVVDEVDLHDLLRQLEGRVRRRLVAEMPLIDRVVRRDLVNRRFGLGGDPGVDDCGQHAIVDDDGLGRVLGLGVGLGHDAGDMVTDIAHLACASAGCGPAFIGEPSLEWIIQPQISPPILSAARSSPVSTASTPGIASAFEASIRLMVACACGERRKQA